MLEVRCYIDPVTGQPHIYGHGVDEEEVIDVLERPAEDRPGRDGSRVALGRTTRWPVLAGYLRAGPRTRQHIRDYGLGIDGQTASSVPEA